MSIGIEITDILWKAPRTSWRTLTKIGSNQGVVQLVFNWKNPSDVSVIGTLSARLNGTEDMPISYSTNTVAPNQWGVSGSGLDLRMVPPEKQGEWYIHISVETGGITTSRRYNFTVGHEQLEKPDSIARQLGKVITQEFSVEHFGEPKRVALLGNYDEGLAAHCSSESGLRYALLGGQYQPSSMLYYETKLKGDLYWQMACQSQPLLLNVAIAYIDWEGGDGHWVCALQIAEDTQDMDSWVFFQFQENDIKPGDSQMQSPGSIRLCEVTGFFNYGIPRTGAEIVKWDY